MTFTVLDAFLLLQFLPVDQHAVHAGDLNVTKNMRVAADDLTVDALQHLRHGELALLDADLGMEQDLQHQIAKFLAKRGRVLSVEGGQGFVGLFQQVLAQ